MAYRFPDNLYLGPYNNNFNPNDYIKSSNTDAIQRMLNYSPNNNPDYSSFKNFNPESLQKIAEESGRDSVPEEWNSMEFAKNIPAPTPNSDNNIKIPKIEFKFDIPQQFKANNLLPSPYAAPKAIQTPIQQQQSQQQLKSQQSQPQLQLPQQQQPQLKSQQQSQQQTPQNNFNTIENSAIWRTLIGAPEEGYTTKSMIDDTINALPMIRGAGTAAKGALNAAKNIPIAGKAISGILGSPGKVAEIVKELPTPVKIAAAPPTAIAGMETYRGATNPDMKENNFFTRTGASLRAGVGDVIENMGQVSKWQGADNIGNTLVNAGQNLRTGYEVKPQEFTWKSFFDPDFYSSNVARTVPFTMSLIPAMAAGYKGAGAAVGKILNPFQKAIISSLGGAALSRPLESAMEAGNTYQDAIARGMTEEQADQAANSTFKKNLALAGLDAAQLAAAFAPSPIKATTRLGKAAVATGRVGFDAVTEGLEEGVQEVFQRQALGDKIAFDARMQESMGIGAVFGTHMGGIGVVHEAIQNKVIEKLPPAGQQAFTDTVNEYVNSGMPQEQAVQATFDDLANTQIGKDIVVEATQEVISERQGLIRNSGIPGQLRVKPGTDNTQATQGANINQVMQDTSVGANAGQYNQDDITDIIERDLPTEISDFVPEEDLPEISDKPVIRGIKDINNGDAVYDGKGNKFTVIDNTDPSILKIQNERGTIGSIGRKKVLLEPPAGQIKQEVKPDQNTVITSEETPKTNSEIGAKQNNTAKVEQYGQSGQSTNQTANDITNSFGELASGLQEAGYKRTMDLVAKQGYVGFKKKAAADLFRKNPKYAGWKEEQINGEYRFSPPGEVEQEIRQEPQNNLKAQQQPVQEKPVQEVISQSMTYQQPEIDKFIDEALKEKQVQKYLTLRRVTPGEADVIKQLINVDVTGFKHEINSNDLRHAMKHGDSLKEAKSNQLPITDKDLKAIPDVINSPDEILPGSKTRNGTGKDLIYKKQVNGFIYYVEVVNSKKGILSGKTMWKKSSKADHGSDIPTPPYTSETEPGLTSPNNNNINPRQSDVNNNINTNNYHNEQVGSPATGSKSGTSNQPEEVNSFDDLERQLASTVDEKIGEVKPTIGMTVKDITQNPFKANNPKTGQQKQQPPRKEFRLKNEEANKRFQQAQGQPQETTKLKVYNYMSKTLNQTTRAFEHLPAGAKFEPIRFALLELKKQIGVSNDKTLRILQGLTAKMDKPAYTLFRYKVVFDDLINEAEVQEVGPEQELWFGLTLDEMKAEMVRINEELEYYPEVKRAVKFRHDLWSAFKNEYIKAMKDIGFNVEKKLQKQDYYRHLVIKYAEEKYKDNPDKKKITMPTKAGYLKQRGNVNLDINTEFIEAEYEVMSRMMYDIKRAKLFKLIDDKYNIVKDLKRQAIEINDKNIMLLFKEMAQQWNEDVSRKRIDYTGEDIYRQTLNKKQAMAIGKLGKFSVNGLLPDNNGMYSDLIYELANSAYDEDGRERKDIIPLSEKSSNQLYSYANWLLETSDKADIEGRTINDLSEVPKDIIGYQVRPSDRNNFGKIIAYNPKRGMAKVNFKNKEKGTTETKEFKITELKLIGKGKDAGTPAMAAAMLFKGRAEKKQFLKDKLGSKYVTWENIIPEGYSRLRQKEGTIFYFVDSIESKQAEMLYTGLVEEIGVKQEDLQRVMAMGGQIKDFVIPDEIIMTINNPEPYKSNQTNFGKLASGIQRYWKEYQLTSPRRFSKYNTRNASGDFEVMVREIPGAVSKIHQAVKELYPVMFGDRSMTPTMKDWFERGGFETLLQSQEIGSINELKLFVDIIKREEKKGTFNKTGTQLIKAWRFYWNGVRKLTNFREAILRYSVYLETLEQMQKNEGKPKSFLASYPEEVMALDNIKDRAFKLSNELMGAYDQVSVIGQKLREQLIPFWSWVEVNFKREIKIFKNAVRDERLAGYMGRKLIGTAVRSPVIALKVGKYALIATWMWVLLTLWNDTFYPEEEKELSEEERRKPHIIFGRNEDGTIKNFTRLGAFQDFVDWFGVDAGTIQDIRDMLNLSLA
ncbi:hypothetical protein Dtox_3709 [Desulfofarcimen acetoxidans DSM 771]|uniref:Phage-Barnase-EndoU-ColicinE5/D-RelE like nuclease 3 domain-containing protein n=1 Tax=Desulfofarcimen acetoxidans (strain ATCC 49208 / DSM 771 / KCTC 5769 / VKM B-1644 / 5575) TaxID=485916 RepID=C8VWQ3_DESAS|nr:hypothetical protein [Desulfofarcimen acetoxidans]ACV64417.1 hypothetical protein Dtox_3709 [Desulfofarcimen acetoxidans DSM 771]